MHKATSAIWLIVLCSWLLGCPGKPGPQAGGTNGKEKPAAKLPSFDPSDQAAVYKRGMELSLLAGTPMEVSPPDALDFNRDGRVLFAHGADLQSGGFYVAQFDVHEQELVPTELFVQAKDLILPRIASSPTGEECVAMSQYQQTPDSHIKDVLYRLSAGFPEALNQRSGLPYQNISGLPQGDHDTYFMLHPFYSWDGQDVVLPLNDGGVAVVATRTGAGKFYPYPESQARFENGAFGTLPGDDGRRIWASFFNLKAGEDDCEVWLLDLTSGEWSLMFALNWAVDHVGVGELLDPWLVSGTYSNLEQVTEDPAGAGRGGARIPRLARVTPVDATLDLLPLGGEPVDEIALSPEGTHAFYMDRRRKAMVRLAVESGELSIDDRWFTPDREVELFCCEDGERCYAFRDSVLVRAAWQREESIDMDGGDE